MRKIFIYRVIHYLPILLLLMAYFTQPVVGQQAAPTSFPTPRQILGYDLGDRYTSYADLEHYLLTLQQAAPAKMKLLQYGETFEHRKLYQVIISDSVNVGHLSEIKSKIARLTDPRTTSMKDAQEIITTTPGVAWLSYNVHGNEASCSEAALNVIYQLLSASDQATASMLQNLVIVIDPLLNPDGHERYVNFERTHSGVGPIDDRNAVEHHEDWPWGRTNHYLFDLNRDWAWLTQPESRARIKAYREWMPQVHVDFHEMGYNSSYFFFPPFKPVNKNIPPSTGEWDKIFGKANAEAFDKKGWNYWSGEEFDLFYPGYGDSWPSLHGAIGMTYEQAGQAGVHVRRSDEVVLTLKDRIEHHSTTSLTTLRTASENRMKILNQFYTFYSDALEAGRNGPVKAYIVDPTKDSARAAKMASLLLDEGVEVDQASQNFSVHGVHTYFSKETDTKNFPAGAYIIQTAQPSERFLTALLELEPVLSDTFFYDISTWTLPLAYGVETYWTGSALSVPMNKISIVVRGGNSVAVGKAGYAYLIKWNSNNAPRGLAWLLQHNYKVNVAMKEFVLNDGKFARGTLIVPVAGNPATLDKEITDLAQKYGLSVTAANSGFTQSGIDLGSDRAVRLKKPSIAVITNPPVNPECYGEIWAMFDMMYGIEFVPMKIDQLRSADLHDYTAIIFPDDNSDGRGYRSQIDSNFVQKIKSWISGGGTYIGIEGGAAFASSSVGKIASVKIKEKKNEEEKKDTTKGGKLSEEELEKRMTVAEKERKSRLDEFPGTILHVKLDTSHTLGFGYDPDIAVFKEDNTLYELSEHGYNVGIYTHSPRMSGYLSKENEKKVEETPYLIHEQLGAGNIVLFTDDPNFRLFWDGLNKLFLNSVLLMPSIRNVALTSEGK